MPREFGRNVRVASQLQRELAELLRSDYKDPRLGMITVSDVEVTRDLSVAKVFVSFLGAQQDAAASLAILAEKAPALRHAVGAAMRMRSIPELRFLYDDSLERGFKMDALLDELKSRPGPHSDS
jgi:ribosome-binding factor A